MQNLTEIKHLIKCILNKLQINKFFLISVGTNQAIEQEIVT